MRPLPVPSEASGDSHSTEMLRVWLVNGDVRVSKRVGMWDGEYPPNVDEREAWGFIAADVLLDIASELTADPTERKKTVEIMKQTLLKHIERRA